MDKNGKAAFVKSILSSVESNLIKNLDKYPDEWDGVELRWLIVDHVAENVVFGSSCNKKGKRYNDYRNARLIENL
jgi:hypothetical protein